MLYSNTRQRSQSNCIFSLIMHTEFILNPSSCQNFKHSLTKNFQVHLPKPLFLHSEELFPAAGHLCLGYDEVPGLLVCVFSATICGQREVAVGEEMDGGTGTLMDTGSLAELGAPVHLALVTIVLLPIFLELPMIELAER